MVETLMFMNDTHLNHVKSPSGIKVHQKITGCFRNQGRTDIFPFVYRYSHTLTMVTKFFWSTKHEERVRKHFATSAKNARRF